MALVALGFVVLMVVDHNNTRESTRIFSPQPTPPTTRIRVPKSAAPTEAVQYKKQTVLRTRISHTPLSKAEFKKLFVKSDWPNNEKYFKAVEAIARCESSMVPGKIGKSGDYGLMQVNYEWHRDKVSDPKVLLDPLTNLNIAYEIYEEADHGDGRSGFKPWRPSNDCHGLLG